MLSGWIRALVFVTVAALLANPNVTASARWLHAALLKHRLAVALTTSPRRQIMPAVYINMPRLLVPKL